MLEKIGNIFEQTDADAVCFTSNGCIDKNGELVMGAGIAKQFKDRFPGIAFYFGQWVSKAGNKLFMMDNFPFVISFPTKHHWKDKSDMKLIEESATTLIRLSDRVGFKKVYLPRPGCGLGGLNWEKEVKPVLEKILDNRFIVVSQ